jgi:hypothetical protein
MTPNRTPIEIREKEKVVEKKFNDNLARLERLGEEGFKAFPLIDGSIFKKFTNVNYSLVLRSVMSRKHSLITQIDDFLKLDEKAHKSSRANRIFRTSITKYRKHLLEFQDKVKEYNLVVDEIKENGVGILEKIDVNYLEPLNRTQLYRTTNLPVVVSDLIEEILKEDFLRPIGWPRIVNFLRTAIRNREERNFLLKDAAYTIANIWKARNLLKKLRQQKQRKDEIWNSYRNYLHTEQQVEADYYQNWEQEANRLEQEQEKNNKKKKLNQRMRVITQIRKERKPNPISPTENEEEIPNPPNNQEKPPIPPEKEKEIPPPPEQSEKKELKSKKESSVPLLIATITIVFTLLVIGAILVRKRKKIKK